jgi:hypothetical protein
VYSYGSFFPFPAGCFCRLRVRKRRGISRGEGAPPDSNPLRDPEFEKVSLGSQDKFVSRILDLSRTQSCPFGQIIEAVY